MKQMWAFTCGGVKENCITFLILDGYTVSHDIFIFHKIKTFIKNVF